MNLSPTTTPTDELETLWRLAQRIAKTPFAGAYKGRADDAFAAILAGREAGLQPMQSLSGIDVIDGRPSFSPELMRALVARAGHRLDVLEATEEACVMAGVRADTGAGAQVRWTMEDARRAGLVGRGAWKTYPRAMLAARCTAELCRLLFADVIAGLSYGHEEAAAIRGGAWSGPVADVDDDLPALAEVTSAAVAFAEVVEADLAADVYEQCRALAGTAAAGELRDLAAARGRRITVTDFRTYPEWRAEIEDRLAALVDCTDEAELVEVTDADAAE